MDGQGNFGSIDDDPPAAMRYTEARLTKLAASLLEDIDKETVDFKPNYGRQRAGTGSSANARSEPADQWQQRHRGGHGHQHSPHNLGEIIDATIALVNKPTLTLAEVLQIVPGPDFPTGGFILGRQGVVDAYTKGRGSIKMRAKAAHGKVGQRPRVDCGHRDSLSGEQGAAD